MSEYLGLENMLSLVCLTFDGVKALESYEKDGSISKGSGLRGLGTAIGQKLEGRFNVFCLEHIRYVFLLSMVIFDIRIVI